MNGLPIIRKFEGCKLKAYLCPAKVWTIGWGSTFYENGSKVKQGDIITQDQADLLLIQVYKKFEADVLMFVKLKLRPNQLGALVSFTFNVGVGNLSKSTLLKLVNTNPNNEAIRVQFMKWNRAGGKVLNGLTRRRQDEADLYFKP